MELIYEFLRWREIHLAGEFNFELGCPILLFRRPPLESSARETKTETRPLRVIVQVRNLLAKSNRKIRDEAHEFRVFRLRVKPDGGNVLHIGRAVVNDLVLGHRSVSHHHADIIVEEHRVSLVDRGSKNGTFVGNHRLVPAQAVRIQPGDDISFGSMPVKMLDAEQFYEFLSTLTE